VQKVESGPKAIGQIDRVGERVIGTGRKIGWDEDVVESHTERGMVREFNLRRKRHRT